MKRVLKKLLKIFLGILALPVVFGALFLAWPKIVFNNQVLEWTAGYLSKQGIHLEWEKADLSALSSSFWQKRVSIDWQKGCVRAKGLGLDACFDRFAGSIILDFKRGIPRIVKLGPLGLDGARVNYVQPPEDKIKKAPPPKKDDGSIFDTLAFLQTFNYGRLRLDAPEINAVFGADRARGKLFFSGETNNGRAEFKGLFEGHFLTGKEIYRGKLKLDAGGGLSTIREGWTATAEISAQLPKKDFIEGKFQGASQSSGIFSYGFDLRGRYAARPITTKATGVVDQTRFFLGLNARVLKVADTIAAASVTDCTLSWKWKEFRSDIGNVLMRCPLRADVRVNAAQAIARPADQPLEALLVVDSEVSGLKGNSPRVAGKVELTSEALLSRYQSGKIAFMADVSGALRDFPKGLKGFSKNDLEIVQFEKLVKGLKDTSFAIPAPFNNLKGRIGAQVQGSYDGAKLQGEFPIRLDTDLKSDVQRLLIEASGKLSLRPNQKTHLAANVLLNDVQVVLPYLSLKAPPPLFPDSRIESRGVRAPLALVDEKEEESNFEYNIQINTPSGKPIRFVSNLAKDKIPLHTALKLSSQQGVSGSFRITQFSAELFRRQARVHHFDLRLEKDPRNSEVNGEIIVPYSDYTVKVAILGSIKEPQIRLSSDPAVPEDKLWAVLLFGRPLDQLDANETNSVAETKVGVEQGAISLGAMYVLASTPIESVFYNPNTRSFTARVRLLDGTSLSVGSQEKELKSLGIRQSLGKNWSIHSYFENLLDTQKRTLSTYLEWSKSY